MSGEWELLLGSEDPDADAMLFLNLGFAGKNEGGFGEVGLAGEGLHLVCGKAACISEDGELIAFERALGEDVDLSVVVCTVSGGWGREC